MFNEWIFCIAAVLMKTTFLINGSIVYAGVVIFHFNKAKVWGNLTRKDYLEIQTG
jgi:hypothetical protein